MKKYSIKRWIFLTLPSALSHNKRRLPTPMMKSLKIIPNLTAWKGCSTHFKPKEFLHSSRPFRVKAPLIIRMLLRQPINVPICLPDNKQRSLQAQIMDCLRWVAMTRISPLVRRLGNIMTFALLMCLHQSFPKGWLKMLISKRITLIKRSRDQMLIYSEKSTRSMLKFTGKRWFWENLTTSWRCLSVKVVNRKK